jgi:hypothetical protein
MMFLVTVMVTMKSQWTLGTSNIGMWSLNSRYGVIRNTSYLCLKASISWGMLSEEAQ